MWPCSSIMKTSPSSIELDGLGRSGKPSPLYPVTVVRRIDLCLRKDDQGRIREHFGLSSTAYLSLSPMGPTINPDRRNPWHGVAAGDLLIGHLTADGDPAPGPIVSDMAPGADALPQGTAPHGFRDLGLDGTYLVIRELRQDVAAFGVDEKPLPGTSSAAAIMTTIGWRSAWSAARSTAIRSPPCPMASSRGRRAFRRMHSASDMTIPTGSGARSDLTFAAPTRATALP